MTLGRLGNLLRIGRKEEVVEATPEETKKWLNKLAEIASNTSKARVSLDPVLQNNANVRFLCSTFGKKAQKNYFDEGYKDLGNPANRVLRMMHEPKRVANACWLIKTVGVKRDDIIGLVLKNSSRLEALSPEELQLLLEHTQIFNNADKVVPYFFNKKELIEIVQQVLKEQFFLDLFKSNGFKDLTVNNAEDSLFRVQWMHKNIDLSVFDRLKEMLQIDERDGEKFVQMLNSSKVLSMISRFPRAQQESGGMPSQIRFLEILFELDFIAITPNGTLSLTVSNEMFDRFNSYFWNYYGTETKIRSIHPLLLHCGGSYEHTKELTEELLALETERPELLNGTPEERFRKVCEYSFSKVGKSTPTLQRLPFTIQQQRGNAETANELQKKRLQVKGKKIPAALDPSKRSLILYFREQGVLADMDAFAFSVMYWTINTMVERGHTQIFNNVQVVSRDSKRYPHFLHKIGLPPENYLDVSDQAFKDTRIYANMVYPMDSEIIDAEYDSVPILGTAVQNYPRRMNDVKDYVPLHLYFAKEKVRVSKTNGLENDPERDRSASIAGIMSATAEAVLDLEKKILDDVKLEQK